LTWNTLERRLKKKSAGTADAVTLGDAWLAPAIQAGALQPIADPERWRWWVRLPAFACLMLTFHPEI